MRVTTMLIVPAALGVLGTLLPGASARAFSGMHGPGWDYPAGIWTPSKQANVERRQALRSWWYAPITAPSATDPPALPPAPRYGLPGTSREAGGAPAPVAEPGAY